MNPTCCRCGREVTNAQAYGWDKRRRLFWCDDCADPLPPEIGIRAALIRVLSWLSALWGAFRP